MEDQAHKQFSVYDLQAEIATEAVPSLGDGVPCDKNPGHHNFIPYDEFELHHLPEHYRTEKLYRYLKDIGNSVVRLTVTCEDGSMRFGSGIVMKYRGKLYIYTNNHVVETDQQAKNCLVEFYYDGEESFPIQTRASGLMHTFADTDKSMLILQKIPSGFQHDFMPDSGRCRAVIKTKTNDGTETSVRGLACVHNNIFSIVLRQSSEISWTEELVKEASIYFREFDDGERIYAKCSSILEADTDRVYLTLDPVPDMIKAELEKEQHFWDFDEQKLALPIAITHPHGGPKMVTIGQKIIVEKKEDEGVVLQHSAPTCGGSSGGAVIAVGEDNRVRGLYAYSYLHCKGKKVTKLVSNPKTDSDNYNTSSLSIWL
ncbi:hypothetical protein SNE40_022849 [Patella caerulea]|uniref:Serine protease n=1 Tax=Patella caerulea TaxID=87958 RepID=A0AAN8FX54_PATCE